MQIEDNDYHIKEAVNVHFDFFRGLIFLSLYFNMAAPNMKSRLHLRDVLQNSPASFKKLNCPPTMNFFE